VETSGQGEYNERRQNAQARKWRRGGHHKDTKNTKGKREIHTVTLQRQDDARRLDVAVDDGARPATVQMVQRDQDLVGPGRRPE
jgi:hypothetical protein